MKRELLSWAAAIVAMGALAGGANAQSTPDTGVPSSSSPSTTPNDGTAVPPNTPVPPGQIPPAGQTDPMQGNQGTMSGSDQDTKGGSDSGMTSQGSPGSKTGMPQDQNQVPNRDKPSTNEPDNPPTGGSK